MKRLNQFTALVLSILLIMSSIGAAAAEGDSIQVLGKNYTHTTNHESTMTWGGNSVSFKDLTLTYEVTVPTAGAYMIRPRFGTYKGDPSVITLEVNGNSLGSYTIDPTDTASNFSAQTEYDIAIAWFNEGVNTFKIGCTHNIYMSYFTLVPQNAGSLKGSRESLKIGDENYIEAGTYPRGTDTITAGYDTPLLSGSFGSIELVDEASEAVAFEATASGKELTIALAETLDYEESYTLTLKGVKDMYGNELTEESFTFSTSDEAEDSGSGSVTIDSFDIVSDDAAAAGTVMGSHGKGIAGRKVKLWITIPNGEPVMLAEGVSGQNGAYTLKCNLTDYDIDGDVRAEVAAEYANRTATAVKEDYMSAANQIKFMGGNYTGTTRPEQTTPGTPNSTSSVYYGTGITLTYEFTAVREGGYMFTLEQATYKGAPTTLTFELDGETIYSYVFDPVTTDGNLGPMGTYDICGVWLTQGKHTLKIANQGVTHRIWNIIFTKQQAASFEAAEIGGEVYSEGDKYYRGTDSISLNFSGNVNAESLKGITLAEVDGKNIGVEAKLDESDSKKIVVSLKDSLDYTKTYTLTASGIKDSVGYTVEDIILSFGTSAVNEADVGTGIAVIDSFEIKNGVAAVKGVVKGSTGVGISGRKVDFYITLPEYPETLAASAITTAGGAYTMTYTLVNDDAAGDCTAGIKAEYADSKVTDTYYYVSANRLTPILNALAATTLGAGSTQASVEYVLKQNKINLGIDPEIDLAGITASEFYDMLIGADVDTVQDFHKLYKASIALQKLNEAAEASEVKAIIGENISVLEIDADKLSALKPVGSDKFYDEILNADGKLTRIEDFAKLFDTAYNKALMAQADLSDITLISGSDSGKQGEELSLTIASDTSYKDAKEIKLDIIFAGDLADNINDVEFTSTIGTAKTTVNDNTANVAITVTDPEVAKTAVGELSFTASKVGTGTVTVSGSMTASTGTDYDAELNIASGRYSVTVNEQKSSKISRNSGSGGSSVSGGSVITPVEVSQEPVVSPKSFTDLSEAVWAEEAILGLYNRQAINMTEERLFYPNREITRAEFLKMVVLANDMYTGSSTVVDFNDVKEGDWYYQYVEAAVNFKLIEGDGNGNFNPNALITREDICVILSRIGNEKNASMTELFDDDADISEYARTAVYVMKETGIVNGTGDNLFAPKANATRAMAAKIIYGLVK